MVLLVGPYSPTTGFPLSSVNTNVGLGAGWYPGLGCGIWFSM